ncbi:DNA-binding protein [Pseudomonas fragariae (ex Marin et al. 2024)]|uniref:DNA-binding protein n=1 Tax=Pseudomonas fragariae (ex Marin et al. 2024) TaxID=3080056 RepID=UPI003F7A9298
MKALRTHQEAKLWLEAHGISVAEFCRTHGLDQFTVYQVLDGRKKGLRGKAYKAAVALGIKMKPSDEGADGHPCCIREEPRNKLEEDQINREV